jgi:hypothetical protein
MTNKLLDATPSQTRHFNGHLTKLRNLAHFVNTPREFAFLAELWTQQQIQKRPQKRTNVIRSLQNREFPFKYIKPTFAQRTNQDFLDRLTDAEILMRDESQKAHTYRFRDNTVQTDLLLHWAFAVTSTLPQHNIPLQAIIKDRRNDKFNDLTLIHPMLALAAAKGAEPVFLAKSNLREGFSYEDQEPSLGATFFQQRLALDETRWKNLRRDMYKQGLLEKGDDVLKEVEKYSLAISPAEITLPSKYDFQTNTVRTAIKNNPEAFEGTFSLGALEFALQQEGIEESIDLKSVVQSFTRQGLIHVDEDEKLKHRTWEGGSRITHQGIGILNCIYIDLVYHMLDGYSNKYQNLRNRYSKTDDYRDSLNPPILTHAIQIGSLPRLHAPIEEEEVIIEPYSHTDHRSYNPIFDNILAHQLQK